MVLLLDSIIVNCFISLNTFNVSYKYLIGKSNRLSNVNCFVCVSFRNKRNCFECDFSSLNNSFDFAYPLT
jgi:hypothetical protein